MTHFIQSVCIAFILVYGTEALVAYNDLTSFSFVVHYYVYPYVNTDVLPVEAAFDRCSIEQLFFKPS